MTESTTSSTLEMRPGENCWKKSRVDRLQFLPGGAVYFSAFRRAVLSARKRVVLLGWDLDTRIDLVRGMEPEDDYPLELGPFLEAVLDDRPELEIFLLIWDFSLIYAVEREWQPLSKTLRSPHPRLHYRVDDKLPAGASHHQKVVLIDDEIAFSGGLDLSAWRWDTTERETKDDRRTDPGGDIYDPYHDIQVVFSGPMVEVMKELCEYRWQRATGEALPGAKTDGEETGVQSFPWTDLGGWEEGSRPAYIARTFADWKNESEINEIEQWHLEAIASARDCLYFENQYFSSNKIKTAIIERLEETGGPEVIIVLNEDTGGFMEESTMGVMRDAFFRELSAADHEDRLRLLHPVARSGNGDASESVYVHAKILIVDNQWVKVGSANLSNRSMHVDSEVDLIFEAGEADDGFAHRVRNRLLACHFAREESEIAEAIDRRESLGQALDDLFSDETNTLAPIPLKSPNRIARRLSEEGILDPEEPIDPRNWIKGRIQPEEGATIRKRVLKIAVFMLLLIAIGVAISETWETLAAEQSLEPFLEDLRGSFWSPFALIGLFVIAGLIGFPINGLLLALTVVINPWLALLYGYLGSHLSALAGFAAGRGFGDRLLRWVSEESRDKLEQKLDGGSGIITVSLLRVLPIAPFVVVNLAAGASPLRWSVFNLGTLIGMLPGMTVVIFLVDRLKALIDSPSWQNGLIFGVLVLVCGGLVIGIRKTLASGSSSDSAVESASSS